jgi:acetyltransferase
MFTEAPAKPGRLRPERLFRPESVALVGATGAEGALVLENLRAGGFAGAILTAEPETVADLPAPPDLAIVCAEGEAAAAALIGLGRRGAGAAVLIGDVADARALARQGGVRVLGPASFGIAVPAIGLNATVGHLKPAPGRVALVAQSVAFCRAVLDWAGPNGIGFSHVIGVGAGADLGFDTVLDWLSRDPDTGAILIGMRGLVDARRFLSAARAAARLHPVVALYAGWRVRDPTGTAETALVAALRRAGVLGVASLGDLLAAAETLTRARPARGDALGVVGNALGPAWLSADAALREDVALAAEPVVARAVADATTRLAENAAVGGVVVAHAPGTSAPEEIAALAGAARAAPVPVLVAALGEMTGAEHRRRLAAAGVAAFAAPEQAVRGFLHLRQHRRNRLAARELPPSTLPNLAPDRDAVARAFAVTRDSGRAALTQEAALAVLAAYGIPVAPTRLAEDAAAAMAAAVGLGFPVVLKRRRAGPPSPGERGAIALDLRDTAQVHDAARMLAHRALPGGAPGFLVQKQAGRARELLVRVDEDAVFGPTLGFGQGGTAAEAFGDVALELPPLNLVLAQALIARTRVAGTLGALRDQPAADVAAIADAIVRVSQLIVDFPEIAALEINPLFADAAGVQAADAWITLRAPDAPRARLAIAPYPAELVGMYQGRSETFLVRPIRPEDAEAHAALFARLSPEDVRFRFFSAIRALSPEQIARLTQVDYEREIAFVAVREASGETVGVARLVRETEDEAEFAVLVQEDARGQGLASHLMQRLIDWARARGVACVNGEILADNASMLGLARRLGFALHHAPDDATVVEARLAL